MTPADYFMSFVVGNWEDFQANQDSIRHAFNAAVAASQMADHFYEYHKRRGSSRIATFPQLSEYLKHVSNCTQGAFTDIRSIATAYKHLYPTRKQCCIASTGAIETLPLVGRGIREVRQGDALDSPASSVVQFTRKGEGARELMPVLEKVIDYWQVEVWDAGSPGEQA